ncbi:MAG: hypothetical protein OXR73_34965 [Myxococcales bacterium]|nr:hypothetical protein [Myxococcales bacterium]
MTARFREAGRRVSHRPATPGTTPGATIGSQRAPMWALALIIGAAAASPARAYHEPSSEWVAGTAYTLGVGEVSLGVLRWEVGVLDEVLLGTNVLPWALGPLFGAVVPNGYIKVRDWVHGSLAVSASFQLLYLDASGLLEAVGTAPGSSSSLTSLSATGSGSYRWTEDLTTSVEAQFNATDLSGDNEGLAFEGSAVLNNLALAALAEWRLTRVIALQLTGRVLVYQEPPTFDVRFQADPRTDVHAKLRANLVAPIGAWSVVPSVAISGQALNVKLGAGYGHRWLPVLGLVVAPGPVVDFDFFVRF